MKNQMCPARPCNLQHRVNQRLSAQLEAAKTQAFSARKAASAFQACMVLDLFGKINIGQVLPAKMPLSIQPKNRSQSKRSGLTKIRTAALAPATGIDKKVRARM